LGQGSAFDEAKAINQSLTILGRCIEILASNKKERPPFRESKLTRLLSNAIGGAAKTTLIVCVAPTMTDQFETTNSLEFGQQAMNVVVRAKVNASTDYSSLTASLMAQRDAKQKPIHQLEMKVLQELQPQLDQVVKLELECKEADLALALAAEEAKARRGELDALKAEGAREQDEDKRLLAEALNTRAKATEELEQVLVQMADNAEMREIQARHEAEKRDTLQTTVALQEELQSAEMQERHERKGLEAQSEGAIHTARNLGQLAAYFLQTGATQEAADFYLQAKSVFDAALGPEHPRTQQWQQELFFLINAPAIQAMLATKKESGHGGGAGGAPAAANAQEWWLENMSDAAQGDGDWWMRNLYEMNWRDVAAPAAAPTEQQTGAAAATAPPLFSSDGPAFTPRGTLAMPAAPHDRNGGEGKPSELAPPVNLQFATEWVEQVFTPRAGAGTDADVDARMADAVSWLQSTFATPRAPGAAPPLQKVGGAAPGNPWVRTPRAGPDGSTAPATQQSDDAVMAAAMQAVLATPRPAASDAADVTISSAANKIFGFPSKQRV
jgi:hypothetical protein